MDGSSPSVVDLTVGSAHPLSGSPPAMNSSRPTGQPSSQSNQEPRGTKRRRLSDSDLSTEASSSSTASPDRVDEENIESVDLTEVDNDSALSKALAKQREDAVKAQTYPGGGKGRSILTSYKCPVCMDTPVDATTTICGHLFCHKCIIDTLKVGEEQRSDSSGKGPRGNCPVCRKPLSRNDASGTRRNLVPLQLKLATKKRDSAKADEAQAKKTENRH